MLLTEQLAHQGFVHPGPLVLWATPLKIPTVILDRGRQINDLIASRFGLYLPFDKLRVQRVVSEDSLPKQSLSC